MRTKTIPSGESPDRLEQLRVDAARRLVPPPELLGRGAIDALAQLASRLLGAASSQVALLTDIQIVAGGSGLEAGAIGSVSPIEDSLCQVVAAEHRPVAITDSQSDPRVALLPPVISGYVGAYLGVPLISEGGYVVGALCVFDASTHEWSTRDEAILQELGAAVVAALSLAALGREFDTNRARWDLAVEAGDIGSFDWDLRSGVLSWDERLIAMYGYDGGDKEFDRSIASVNARVHPDDLGLVTTVMADAIADVGPLHVVYRIVIPKVGTRWLEARGRALPGPDGVATRLLGISFDVTARQDQEARADRLLRSMPVGFLALDAQWRVTLANAEAARILGMKSEFMLARSLWEILPQAVDSDSQARYRRVARSRVPDRFDAHYPYPHDAWFDVRVWPENDGLTLYFIDVTDRRLAQQRLEAAARHDRTVAQTLQAALLTQLPEPDHLHLEARYSTAADDQVGGDWYDAVVQPGGATTVMIGDVVGHDITAAATMGQLRSMLRMLAWRTEDPPSRMLTKLDQAAHDMGLGTTATVIAARIEQSADDQANGLRTLRWSNAGHPPPILLHADGRAEVLQAQRADLLLGVLPDGERCDYTHPIPPDSTLVIYTDGLIESRTLGIDERISRLCEVLRRHVALPPGELLDAVIAEMVGDSQDDDVAVLAVRFNDENKPRPVEAGPAHV